MPVVTEFFYNSRIQTEVHYCWVNVNCLVFSVLFHKYYHSVSRKFCCDVTCPLNFFFHFQVRAGILTECCHRFGASLLAWPCQSTWIVNPSGSYYDFVLCLFYFIYLPFIHLLNLHLLTKTLPLLKPVLVSFHVLSVAWAWTKEHDASFTPQPQSVPDDQSVHLNYASSDWLTDGSVF